MVCPICYGRRIVLSNGQAIPCPECQGQGELHCCDGLQEQPEQVEPDAEDQAES
jgi:hypothetical protein